MRFTASLFFLAIASIASAQTVDFAINPAQTAPISPYIYGINGSSVGNYTNATFDRVGGNRLTAYNWVNNASNAGSDWYFENDDEMDSGPNQNVPGDAMNAPIQSAFANNAGIVLAVPINGYVAADKLGGNANVMYYPGTTTLDPNWLSDRFDVELPTKPGAPATFTLTPNLNNKTVYEDEFVNWVKTEYPSGFTTNSTTPIWFELDNEPDLWASTHREIRPIVPGSITTANPLGTPAPVTYAELIKDSIAYAAAIKAVAPNTKVFGPVSYGWEGYTTLQNAPDSGSDGDFVTYYLNQMAAASQAAGERLVDVLDLHWYPEATGAGIRITTADTGYSGSTLAAIQAARIQAPRSLWDPTYVENSWITADSTNGQAIQLLPREQAKIAATAATYGSKYTADQISISEYNYGGGDDISGGIAEADVLGIFGQRGVLSANEWQLNANESFIGGAFQMYRNYDGKGSTFGDISVATTNSNAANASIYASDDSTNSGRMVLVAINKTTGNLTAQLPLPNAPDGKPFTEAAIYDLTANSPTPQFVEDIAITNPANFSYTMPGYSVTTIALTVASSAVWSRAVSGNWSSTANWTGGVPNAIGAGAVFSASTTAALTITLDVPVTVGTLLLGNSGNAAVGYALSGTGSNTLTLNSSGYPLAGGGATITVMDGTHAIYASVELNDNLAVTGSNSGWVLSFGAASTITGGHSLTMNGNGTLILGGSNSYTGGTFVTAGTLVATNLNALPEGTNLTVGGGATFIFDPSQASTSPASGAVAVPEPGTLGLLAASAVFAAFTAWRRRRN